MGDLSANGGRVVILAPTHILILGPQEKPALLISPSGSAMVKPFRRVEALWGSQGRLANLGTLGPAGSGDAQMNCNAPELPTDGVGSPGRRKAMESGVVAMKDVYKVRESAIKLDVSVRTVYRLIRLGELKIVKLGRSTRVTARSIDEFIKKGGTA